MKKRDRWKSFSSFVLITQFKERWEECDIITKHACCACVELRLIVVSCFEFYLQFSTLVKAVAVWQWRNCGHSQVTIQHHNSVFIEEDENFFFMWFHKKTLGNWIANITSTKSSMITMFFWLILRLITLFFITKFHFKTEKL